MKFDYTCKGAISKDIDCRRVELRVLMRITEYEIKRLQYIRIENPIQKQSEKAKTCH